MSYVTLNAMLEKFGEKELIELTDNEQPYQHQINQGKLQAAMNAANSEIDGYLAGRYSLPLVNAPAFLTSLGCDMAHFHASVGDTQETERTKTRYGIAVKNLTNISKGLISLGGAPAGESVPSKTSANNVQWDVGRRDFGGSRW